LFAGGKLMFVEQRTYDLAIGTQEQWLENYEKYGLEPQTEILGRLVGYFHTDFAELNQVVHMWAYESLKDRSARRKKLFEDPRWLEFLPMVRPLILRQESKMLIPASFSPIR
jgi:hypothetical protein